MSLEMHAYHFPLPRAPPTTMKVPSRRWGGFRTFHLPHATIHRCSDGIDHAAIHSQCPHAISGQCHLNCMRVHLALLTSPIGARSPHVDFPSRYHDDRTENSGACRSMMVYRRSFQICRSNSSHKLVGFSSSAIWDSACQ